MASVDGLVLLPSSLGGLSSLSNLQIADHYADCIKLSSENKINSRNAFGLHLIDYMLEVLVERGELENFQVAGCTLDAGAKIYASRVDSIYTDAYKILGGIGKSDVSEEVQPDVPQPLKERSKGEQSATTIEGNIKVLDLCSKDLQLEMDPIFKHMSEEGLMLWQLHTREDYSLVLDMQCDCVDVDPLYDDIELDSSCLSCVMNSDDEICRPFSTFFMMNNQSMTDFVDKMDVPPCSIDVDMAHPQPDYSMVPFPTNFSESDCDDDASGPFSHDVEVVDLQNVSGPMPSCDANVLGVLGSKNIAYMLDVQDKMSAGGCLITNTQLQSDYSYFDASIFSTWAGLPHWKFKTHPNKEERGERSAPSRRKCAQRICFHDKCDDKSFEICKILTTQIDDNLSCASLPEDVHLRINVLLELFMHSRWKVEKLKPLVIDDELHESWCGYEESSIHDFHNQSSLTASDTIFCENIDIEETSINTLDLVAQPKKVQNVPISYSKTSKKIDAKKLKETMWQVLCTDLVPKAFSHMYCEVYERTPQNMKDDISAPICFVFLLHLANEKGFALIGEGSLCDVSIQVLPSSK